MEGFGDFDNTNQNDDNQNTGLNFDNNDGGDIFAAAGMTSDNNGGDIFAAAGGGDMNF